MPLDNDQKIRVIENYLNIKDYIKTNNELIETLAKHLGITKTLVQHEISNYKANNNQLILKSKL